MLDFMKVDKILKEQNKSRRNLARITGISIDVMSGWASRGTTKISVDHVKKIAKALDVPARMIVRDDVLEMLEVREVSDD